MNHPLERLRHHVSGAIERGEAEPIVAIEIKPSWKQNMGILILALENGTEEGKRLARAELMELAGKLDERQRRERVDELLELKKKLLAERVQTNGHGRRARIQEQIDAADVEINELLELLNA